MPSAASPTDQERQSCKSLTEGYARSIVSNRGQRNENQLLNNVYKDASTSRVTEQVWNYMTLSYQNDKRLSQRQLAILGNAACVGKY
jgi:hypothetical protein